ncbi:MAG: hypothetical protein HY725_09930 [Candidatus Rokubacteria bacterium]|nr:hypothetical protein [Candidatus Rokubacteria bacterium]
MRLRKATLGSRAKFTHLQGQYLAFIEAYTTLNGVAPAEADMQRFFRVTPPAVHRMVLALEQLGFLTRVPGQGRSIRLRLPRDEIRKLERRETDEVGADDAVEDAALRASSGGPGRPSAKCRANVKVAETSQGR